MYIYIERDREIVVFHHDQNCSYSEICLSVFQEIKYSGFASYE